METSFTLKFVLSISLAPYEKERKEEKQRKRAKIRTPTNLIIKRIKNKTGKLEAQGAE